jgi:hypothetical protein
MTTDTVLFQESLKWLGRADETRKAKAGDQNCREAENETGHGVENQSRADATLGGDLGA